MEGNRASNKKLLVARSNERYGKICRRLVLVGKLKLSKILEKPWTYLMVDFITKWPLVAVKDAILIVCNRLSKIIYFVVTTEGTSAEELVRLFRNNIWKLHRLLKSIVSDREPQFAVEMIKELNNMLEIEIKLLTLFYLQTNRQMEYMN